MGAPATRVTTTTAEPAPGPRSRRASASGSIADPRFFTVTRPTSRLRSTARSFLRLNGRTSLTGQLPTQGAPAGESLVR